MIESFKLPNITPETLTGSIVSFNDEYGGLPLKSCTSLISGYQEGSGTPSPSNVRNLVSFNSATLTENGNTHTFTFGQSIYQGSIDWKRGVVVGTHGISTFKGLNEEGWNISGEGTSRRFRIELNGSDNTQSISDRFSWVSSNSGVWGKFRIASNSLLLLDNTSVMADVSALKTWLSNNNASFVYPLATPIEIPLGGINLLTQEGQNNIFADCGDTEVQRLKVN